VRPRRDPHALADAERQRVVDLLGAHMVSGAISPDDLAERTELVLRARTREELLRATEGLPALPRRPLLVRIAERLPLRTHVIVFAAVNAVLVVVWAITREGDTSRSDEGFRLLWPFWVTLGWGVLLVAQALYTLRQPLLLRARRRARRARNAG
jgi:hypothetical protein